MVIYEDNHILAVNKEAGILVQGDRTGDLTILDYYKSYIKEKYDKPGAVFLQPVHRLDRPVSGCLLLGRTSKATSRLNTAFYEKKVQKTYLAISDTPPQNITGDLIHHIVKDARSNISRIVNRSVKKAKKAELSYELIAQHNELSLLKVRPRTGRSHQIRVQLAAIGCPIVGDRKYKGKKSEDIGMIYLHCAGMSFIHPTRKEEVNIVCRPKRGALWEKFHDYLLEES